MKLDEYEYGTKQTLPTELSLLSIKCAQPH